MNLIASGPSYSIEQKFGDSLYTGRSGAWGSSWTRKWTWRLLSGPRAWALRVAGWGRTVVELTEASDELVLVSGLWMGFEDSDAPRPRIDRAPLQETVTFLG